MSVLFAEWMWQSSSSVAGLMRRKQSPLPSWYSPAMKRRVSKWVCIVDFLCVRDSQFVRRVRQGEYLLERLREE